MIKPRPLGGENCIYCYSTSLPAKQVILMKKRQTKGFQFGLQELLSVEEPPEPFSSSPVIPCNCDKNQMIMEIVLKRFLVLFVVALVSLYILQF